MKRQRNTEYYLDLRTDYGFKRVFGEDKELLKPMLNEFLHDILGARITDIVLLPTEMLGFTKKEKRIIFDLYCEDQSLNRIIIEMQREGQDYYENRTLYYMSRSISKSVKRGDKHYRMGMNLSLHLLDYKSDWFRDDSELIRVVQLKDDRNEIFSEKVAIVLVNLCTFAARKKQVSFPSARHKWAYMLRNMRMKTPEDEAKETDPVFRKLYEACRLSNLNEEDMREYRKNVLEYEDVQDAIQYAGKRKFAEGEARGEARGVAIGEARGEVRGETKAKRSMASEMLKKGLPLSLVSEITGLSEAEILSLSE